PEACKGCNICVEVCPENALITVKQDEPIVERLRRNWEFWEKLPDTDERYINVADIEEGIGVLSSLLLHKRTYRSMVGGDGACMGCGEKTAVHLVVSSIEALMLPRVGKLVRELDELIATLDAKARGLLAADADIDLAAVAQGASIDVPVAPEKQAELRRLAKSLRELKDLKWRYLEGPSGRGRAALGLTNSTGCSSVWASTYPFNPYPFPWVNHLFQDSPSVAIGVFEGHMRKMADNFVSVRRARLLASGAYDEAVHEPAFSTFDWQQFDDQEFGLCPPIMAIGGDGAMLDIGFQNLSRLMASGKPIRVLVLDTQVYSNTGGQACTSGYTGQVADMSAWGAAQHGKQETRKELGLIAIAHRGTYVLQSSQASASHLIAGVLKGLQSRRPAIFNIYTPCPVEHGLADDWAPEAAKLALESRAFPFLRYDPDAGESMADCLSLEGNPALDEAWPSYTLTYVDEAGAEQTMTLPLTTADWAATEARFKKNFKAVPAEKWNEDMVPFHEFMRLSADERAGKQPFIYTIDGKQRLTRMAVSNEMVRLAADRLLYWAQLRELAGVVVPDSVRDAIAGELESRYEEQLAAVQAEYEGKLAALRATYPAVVARRMAEGLLRATAGGRMNVAELLAKAASTPGLAPIGADVLGTPGLTAGPATTTPVPQAPVSPETPVAAPAAMSSSAAAVATAPAEADDSMAIEAYIESDRCTTCNECTNLNGKMFAYNVDKQAYIKDPRAGTFAQLVTAAERCPAGLIHPGTPLNPREKDLEKWLKRAEKFN
ncbi:MAG TPA: thiamine pyrophosphate-dependent enzyme, partial [Longimicrobiales bacterium]|nr:thiamine pyrophosphate-dependent enzyme [Longimicrobiales bacterium]